MKKRIFGLLHVPKIRTNNLFEIELNQLAFTIVELLIVITTVGILSVIIFISYNGVTEKAKYAILQSDLVNASKQIEIYQTENGNYPLNVSDCPIPSSGNMCLKTSSGNSITTIITDNNISQPSYCLNIKKDNSRYYIENNGSPKLGSCIGVSDGILAYYPFDIDARDYSGNSRNGSVVGAPQTSGKYNKAYSFNNSTTYINLPSNLGYTNAVSVFAWFKSLGTPGDSYHIVFGGSELELSIPTSGSIRTGIYTNARFVSNHGSGLVDGNWHFVGFTFDGTTKVSYIDGINVGQLVVTGILTSNVINRRIGVFGSSTNYYANGIIDEVRIYDRALTVEEVIILYNL